MKPHTLTPHGIEGEAMCWAGSPSGCVCQLKSGHFGQHACPGDPGGKHTGHVWPPREIFSPHDLQMLQEALTAAPFTLAELVQIVRECPKTLAALRRKVVGS